MKITFLGHASFRIEIADQTLLIDPWLTGNPVLPEDQHQAAVAGATHILLTHAHFDHMADVVRLSKELNVPLVGQYDLMGGLRKAREFRSSALTKAAQSPLAMLGHNGQCRSFLNHPHGKRSAGNGQRMWFHDRG